MTRDATEIVVVADRSGSMMGLIDEMTKGFNGFIDEQRKDPSPASVTLVLFDNEVTTVYEGKALAEVPRLTREVYFARGSTALNDALGMAISKTGARLAAMKEEDRPNKVIVMVMTDGEENCSREYNSQQIKDMVKLQQETYSWKFMFLGVDIDAYGMGQKYGLQASSIVSGKADKLDMLYKSAGASYRASRSVKGTLDTNFELFSQDMKEEAGDTEGK